MIYIVLAAAVIVALVCIASRSNVPYSDSNPPPPPPPHREPSSVQWEKNHFINKRIHHNDEFDCGKGIFFEEHIFSEKWFEQGGVPDGFKMWVPILKK